MCVCVCVGRLQILWTCLGADDMPWILHSQKLPKMHPCMSLHLGLNSETSTLDHESLNRKDHLRVVDHKIGRSYRGLNN